jgi:hypothetical protein
MYTRTARTPVQHVQFVHTYSTYTCTLRTACTHEQYVLTDRVSEGAGDREAASEPHTKSRVVELIVLTIHIQTNNHLLLGVIDEIEKIE